MFIYLCRGDDVNSSIIRCVCVYNGGRYKFFLSKKINAVIPSHFLIIPNHVVLILFSIPRRRGHFVFSRCRCAFRKSRDLFTCKSFTSLAKIIRKAMYADLLRKKIEISWWECGTKKTKSAVLKFNKYLCIQHELYLHQALIDKSRPFLLPFNHKLTILEGFFVTWNWSKCNYELDFI